MASSQQQYQVPPPLPSGTKPLKSILGKVSIVQGTNETIQDTTARASVTLATDPANIQGWEIAGGYANYNRTVFGAEYWDLKKFCAR